MKESVLPASHSRVAGYPPAMPLLQSGNRIKVLIADDSKTDMSILTDMLSVENYEILKAENGAAAVTLYEREQPDLVLMDLYMPVMDGHEATRIIKAMADGQQKYVPVIFLTARDDETVLVESLECGGDDFLVKPFNTSVLKAKIAVVLRNKEMHDTIIKQKRELERAQDFYRQDIEIAETIIRNISRSRYLDIGNIKYTVTPVEILSGDLILCAVTPAKGQVFLVADFTGHGLGAAIGAMIVADAFYAMVFKGYSIEDIVYELNHKLNKTLPTGRFMAASLIELHPGQTNISVINAGLPDILVRSGQGGIRLRIPSMHLPLGVVANDKQNIQIQHYQIEDGDSIYVYSDGLIDTQNDADETFGLERLEQCIADSDNASSIFETVLTEVKRFRGGRRQIDDLSLLEINCHDSVVEDHRYWTDQQMYRPPMDWEFNLKLGTGLIKELNPLPMIVQLMTDMQGINSFRQTLYTIFSELYLNALEHGLLGLDKTISQGEKGYTGYYLQREQALATLQTGEIDIQVRHEPRGDGGEFCIRILDSGKGFDYARQLTRTADGKGIALVKSLCDSIDYQQDGRAVEVRFRWQV